MTYHERIVARVVALTATHYGIGPGDILGRQKTAEIAEARQVAMFLVRDGSDMSMPEIGATFDRDHSTICHAYQVIGRRMMYEAGLRERVRVIGARVFDGYEGEAAVV